MSLFFHLQVPSETEAVEGGCLRRKEHILHIQVLLSPFFFFLGHYTSITKYFQIQIILQVFKATAAFIVSLVKPLPFPSDHAFGLLQNAPKIFCLKIIWLRSKMPRPSVTYIPQLLCTYVNFSQEFCHICSGPLAE